MFNVSENDPTSDIFIRPSSVEYLICTKTTSSEKANQVIGFSVYHEPTSIVALLSDGSLVTLGILYAPNVPKTEDVNIDDNEEINSPLKKVWLKLILRIRNKLMYFTDAEGALRPVHPEDFEEDFHPASAEVVGVNKSNPRAVLRGKILSIIKISEVTVKFIFFSAAAEGSTGVP